MSRYTRYLDREHAVESFRNMFGAELRAARSREQQYRILQNIDLATLPDDLAEKYEYSNRAWHQFLNDIIRRARAWDRP